MQGFNRYPLAVSVVASVALTGCFGGSSSSDDNGDSADLSPVTAENERDVSIAAAESVGAAGDGEGNLEEFSGALGDLNGDGLDGQSVQSMAVHPMDASTCTREDVDFDDDGSGVVYDIDGTCTVDLDSGGEVTLSGRMFFSANNEWNDSRCGGSVPSNEIIYGGDPEFTAKGDVDFRIEGGFGFRTANQMSDAGDFCFNFEYGATEDGLTMESENRSFSLQPSAFTGIYVKGEVDSKGVTDLQQEFYTDGVFELGEGELYEVSFSQDLSTQSGENGGNGNGDPDPEDFQPGGQFCPDSGSMTVSGADGSEVVVTFGEDVEENEAEVRVEGEDITLYEDCDAFYEDAHS